ncbi:MAG: hypothetical protein Q8910_00295 [Bacteroidota bacterium]|nr:hypothetical protein [Bacteroidota bacterium]
MDGEIMIDQILNFYSEGKLSEEAALAGIILERFGPMTDQQLKSRMNNKSVRSIHRYRRALSNLSPVSKLDFNNFNKLTSKQEQNPISEVLSKYGKLPLLTQVNAVFVKHQIEPNAAALEYIIKDILKKNQFRSFTQLLLWSIPVRWGEALVETAPKEEVKELSPTDIPIVRDTPIPERPSTDQDADQVWQQVSPEIVPKVPRATAEMIKRMIPVYKKDSTLYLAVESDFTREWILHKAGNLFNAAFNNICMNYEIILDKGVVSKIA